MLKAWAVVYLGNAAGCLFVAFFMAFFTGLYSTEPWLSGVKSIAESKTNKSFITMFVLGIGANWCVNLACYMAAAGKTLVCKCVVMWFPIVVCSCYTTYFR